MSEDLKNRITENFLATRAQTSEIFDLAREESFLHSSPGNGFRPILWHLAHIGAFEEYWLLQKLHGDSPINESYQRIFDPIQTPRENSKNLPSRREMESYLQKVRDEIWRKLEKINFDEQNPYLRNGYIFDLVHQHELQHQETLAYLFQMLPVSQKAQIPNSKFQIPNSKFRDSKSEVLSPEFVEFSEGEIEIGANGGGFVYDNELLCHKVQLSPFRIDKHLTTNTDFAEFIAEKCYERAEFWSAEGWEQCCKESWQSPLYWTKNAEGWHIKRMFDEVSLAEIADFPVTGVSFYEAEAYANFRGKRLPNEFEWEKAAANAAKNISYLNAEALNKFCNFGFHFWETTPIASFPEATEGTESLAIFDITGNVWEWTSSEFCGFPGFKSFPYTEYSEIWFDGDHRVLKGGSWATSAPILRRSFRNFFRRHFRIAFAGIRLAESVL